MTEVPILYNVTISLDAAIETEWLAWMKNEHIPEVMATGCFVHYRFCRMLSHQEGEGSTYAIQYVAPSMKVYEDYQQNFAPALQQKTRNKFGNRFAAFRTLLEIQHTA